MSKQSRSKVTFVNNTAQQTFHNIISSARTEFRTVSDQSGATALSGFSSRYSLRSCSIGQKAAPTYRGETFGFVCWRERRHSQQKKKKKCIWYCFTVCLTFFPVLMLMTLTFSLPVRALSALLLLFLLLLFTRSWGNKTNHVIKQTHSYVSISIGDKANMDWQLMNSTSPVSVINLLPACLPLPHIRDSPSARWEGPCAEEYAPMDQVHLGLTTKRDRRKSNHQTQSKTVLFYFPKLPVLEKPVIHVPLGPCVSCGCSLPQTHWASEPA